VKALLDSIKIVGYEHLGRRQALEGRPTVFAAVMGRVKASVARGVQGNGVSCNEVSVAVGC
jgi:hypothetical protein